MHKNGYDLCLKCVKKQKKKSKGKKHGKKLKQKKPKRKYRSDELYKIDRTYHNEVALPPNMPFIRSNTSKSDDHQTHNGHKGYGHESESRVNNKHVSTSKKVHRANTELLSIQHNTDQFALKSPLKKGAKINPMAKAGSGSGSSGTTSTGSPRQPLPFFVKRGPVSTQSYGQVNPFRTAQSQPPMSHLRDLEDDISPNLQDFESIPSNVNINQDHDLRGTAHKNNVNINNKEYNGPKKDHRKHSHRGNSHVGHGHKHKQNKNKKDHEHIKSMTVTSPICLTGNEFTFRADYDSNHGRNGNGNGNNNNNSQQPQIQHQSPRKHKKSRKSSHRGHSHNNDRTKSKIKKKKVTLDTSPLNGDYYSSKIDPNNPFSPSFGTKRSTQNDTNIIEFDGDINVHNNMDEQTAFNFPQPGNDNTSPRKKSKKKKKRHHHNVSLTPSPNKREIDQRTDLPQNERYVKRNKKHNQRSKTPRPQKIRKSKSPSRKIQTKRKRSNSIAASSHHDHTDNEYAIEVEDGFIFISKDEYDHDMGL